MAVLFFDEADAFFGRRTHARDAYARYADSEAHFLLLKTENHKKGIVLREGMFDGKACPLVFSTRKSAASQYRRESYIYKSVPPFFPLFL